MASNTSLKVCLYFFFIKKTLTCPLKKHLTKDCDSCGFSPAWRRRRCPQGWGSWRAAAPCKRSPGGWSSGSPWEVSVRPPGTSGTPWWRGGRARCAVDPSGTFRGTRRRTARCPPPLPSTPLQIYKHIVYRYRVLEGNPFYYISSHLRGLELLLYHIMPFLTTIMYFVKVSNVIN